MQYLICPGKLSCVAYGKVGVEITTEEAELFVAVLCGYQVMGRMLR